MNPVIIPQAEWVEMLNALVAAAAPWNGCLLRLFKNNASLGPQTALADLTTCDFTGYADSSAVVFGTAAFQPDGTAVVTAPAKTFLTGSPATVLNTVFGWALINSGATELKFARKFDTPIVLSGPNQLIEVIPAYPAYMSQ